MPTATDLVTDLPADFEVFGQAVDSSMADLKGGTTGQILAKASATDMDFSWITNDVGDITAVTATTPLTGGGTSGAITVGIQDASTSQKGSVQLSDSTSTTSSILAATPTAVKSAYDLAASAYAPAFTNNLYGAKNRLINSNFSVWQRGTSVAISGSNYVVDRWSGYSSTTGRTVSRQSTNDTTNLPTIQYCARVQRDSGNTNTAVYLIGNPGEIVNCIPFAGRTVTLSYYARAGANYSPTSSALNTVVLYGTGSNDTNPNSSGYTGQAAALNTSVTLTTTWQRFTHTFTFLSTVTQFMPYFQANPVGTAGAADYFEVTGVQLEMGSVATPYQSASGSFGSELALCQRYYWRNLSTESSGWLGVLGYYSSTTSFRGNAVAPVSMRTTPTSVDYSTISVDDGAAGRAVTATAISSGGTWGAAVYFTVASGGTANRPANIINNANTAGYIGLSAEL